MIHKGKVTRDKKQGGQTMLLTVMLITSAILSATAISALLILYQLRQVSDIKSSTEAIFAADSGLECLLYERVKGGGNYANCGTVSDVVLDNGASYRVLDEGGGFFKSVGRSGRAARAFEIGL